MKLKTKIRLGLAKVCGAKTRKGTPCQCKQLFRGGRCKFHGGLSTGPKGLIPKRDPFQNLSFEVIEFLKRKGFAERMESVSKNNKDKQDA